MSAPAPERVKHLGLLYLAVGAINLMMGWGISASILTFVGGTCTTVVTLGMCPVGVFCGFVPFLMIPLAFAEIGVGLGMLLAPDALRGVFRFVPFVMIPAILVGDILSPIAGLIGFALGRDEEIQGWAQGG